MHIIGTKMLLKLKVLHLCFSSISYGKESIQEQFMHVLESEMLYVYPYLRLNETRFAEFT